MASADWMKMTKQKAGAMKRHLDKYAREYGGHSNENIDQSKSHLNTYIGCNDYTEAYKAMLQRVAEVDEVQPPKKDMGDKRIISCMIEIPCPLAIQEAGRDQEFFEIMYEVMQEFFGKENVYGMFVHRDEQHEYTDKDGNKTLSLYHGHALTSAYTKEKGINGKAFETRERLRKFNKKLDEKCLEKFDIPFNTGGIAMKQKVEELKKEEQLHELTKQVNDKQVTINEQDYKINDNQANINKQSNELEDIAMLNQAYTTTIQDQETDMQNNNKTLKNQAIDIKNNEIVIQTQKQKLEEQKQAIEAGEKRLNKINAEAKETFYLKESLEKEIEPLQSIIDRRQKMEKQYDKKIKPSKMHKDWWLVHDDIVVEYMNVQSQAGQTLADQRALDERKKIIEAKEKEIKHNQYINQSNERLNEQLRARQRTFDRDIKQSYDKGFEQAIVDVSKALNKSVSAIKSAIDLFNQVEMESDYDYDR